MLDRPKPILCLDFDGVIHSYLSGWQGAAVIADAPVPGAAEFIRGAVEHFRVAIYSSRTGQPGGLGAMRAYVFAMLTMGLDDKGSDVFDALEWPTEKPPAFVSIDDRALTFDGSWPALADLRAFKPWMVAGRDRKEEFPVSIDREGGTITICGVIYAFDVFRHMGFAAIGSSYRLVARADGVVMVEYLDGPAA